jgi:hypothetical protein
MAGQFDLPLTQFLDVPFLAGWPACSSIDRNLLATSAGRAQR